MDKVLIALGGIKIKVESKFEDLISYLRKHFDANLEDEKEWEINVKFLWFNDLDELNRSLPSYRISELDRISKHIFISNNKLAWMSFLRFEGLQLLFELIKEKLYITAFFTDIHGYKKEIESLFFNLTYYLVYYPLFWYLEIFKKVYLLHASAILLGKDGVVMGGWVDVVNQY
jgi:hypothetical protein